MICFTLITWSIWKSSIYSLFNTKKNTHRQKFTWKLTRTPKITLIYLNSVHLKCFGCISSRLPYTGSVWSELFDPLSSQLSGRSMQHQGRNVSRMCCRIHRADMRRKLVFLSLFLQLTKFLPLTISRSHKSMCLYGLGWWLVSVVFFSMAENFYFVTSFKRKEVWSHPPKDQ